MLEEKSGMTASSIVRNFPGCQKLWINHALSFSKIEKPSSVKSWFGKKKKKCFVEFNKFFKEERVKAIAEYVGFEPCFDIDDKKLDNLCFYIFRLEKTRQYLHDDREKFARFLESVKKKLGGVTAIRLWLKYEQSATINKRTCMTLNYSTAAAFPLSQLSTNPTIRQLRPFPSFFNFFYLILQ